MIIVSGCPRSGTSLMMLTLRAALGEDRILGSEFPQARRWNEDAQQQENEADDEFAARLYMRDRRVDPERVAIEEKLTREMNPNGFWECRYSVQGVQWHLGVEEMCTPDKVCKVVSQGLVRTDPKFVDKVIYMARSPRQVAKSQEKLRRMPFMPIEEERELRVHTPKMFCSVTAMAARWFDEYPETPCLLVSFDDLISEPDRVLAGVRDFLGEGDFSNHPVNPQLKRSYPEDIEHHLWPYADRIYELLLEKRWEEIFEYHREHVREIQRDETAVFCTRTNAQMVYNQCVICRSDEATRNTFRSQAEANGINWRAEPCMFECLSPALEAHISMADSIEWNFWDENMEQEEPVAEEMVPQGAI